MLAVTVGLDFGMRSLRRIAVLPATTTPPARPRASAPRCGMSATS